MEQKILDKMAEAEAKAVDSLARYKFLMFGYWAAQWVNMNKLLEKGEPNPFRKYVKVASGEILIPVTETEADVMRRCLRELEETDQYFDKKEERAWDSIWAKIKDAFNFER